MRRGPSLKRKPEADPLFNSVLVSQLTNQVLLDGKKDTARNIVYKALELVEKQAGGDPLNLLKEAFENVKPQIETKSRKTEMKLRKTRRIYKICICYPYKECELL